MAIAVVQILADRDNDAKQLALSRGVETLPPDKLRDQIRDLEKKRQEEIDLDPRDTIDAIKSADGGFLARADMLSLHAAARQVWLVAAEPSLAGQVLAISGDAKYRLGSYEKLKAALAGASGKGPQSLAAVDEIIRQLQTELAYREVAEIFPRKIRPNYENFLSQYAKGHTFAEMRDGIWTMLGRVNARSAGTNSRA
jgi:hypothetical protein